MGDLTKCKSSEERGLSVAGAAGEAGAEAGDARDWVCGEAPATIISGTEIWRIALPEGFFRRILRSPWAYSNSSRLCSVMKRRSCSICSISVFANAELAADLEGFLGFMPVKSL